MLSELNGGSGSEGKLKRVFSYISNEVNINITISMINKNYASNVIDLINFYYTHVHKFLDESNDISKTTRELTNVKNYLSQFSGYITNYITRIPPFLIPSLSRLIKNETETSIKLLNSAGNNNSANGIYKKYQEIKHKVEYCKASLEFEVKRIESISKNAKMLQEHLGKISGILNNYKKFEDKLKELKRKIETLKNNKEKSMNYLKWVVRSIIFNLDKINCISNSLKCRRYFVRITTIKSDIENINSAIKDINNILSVIKSHLEYLFGVNLGVDCKIVNEVESWILEIVCGIHKKYCCLSSDISEIFIDQPSQVGTLEESCQLSKILECASTAPTCSSTQTGDSCERCQDCQSDQGSPGCHKTYEGLQQLLDKSSESNIEQKINSINKIICKLIDGKPVDGYNSGSENHQCSQVCQKGQTNTGTECKGTNIRELIKCTLDKINKCQSSSTLICQGKEEVKCADPPSNGCQSTVTKTTTSCSQSTSSTVSNCNQLDKVKLCIDTMINKCNCEKLKESLKDKNIKSCVDVFKWVMITNFRELFCLYLCFDKSILDQISCNINKLADFKTFISNKSIIECIIKYKIDYIKKEINEIPKQFEILENTMKSGIREMECAIEGVSRNLIRCSLESPRIHVITGSNCVNHNNINNSGKDNKYNNDKRVNNL